MSSLFRDYVASARPRGEPFRSRSKVLCLTGHHPVLSIGGNARGRAGKQPLRSCARALQVSPLGRCLVTQLVGLLNNWTKDRARLYRHRKCTQSKPADHSSGCTPHNARP
jgi:hypothetical protein